MNALKQADDAKKMAKLKALSTKFMTNKSDYLEAIDRFQDRHMQLRDKSLPNRLDEGMITACCHHC